MPALNIPMAHEGNNEGMWTNVSAPSTVDWCEENYIVTPYIAEFWNTVCGLTTIITVTYY